MIVGRCLALFAAASFLAGCGSAPRATGPAAPLDPEQQLAAVMDRFRSRCQSIHDAGASGLAGALGGGQLRLVMEPPTHVFHPAAAPGAEPTADVTLRYWTRFVSPHPVPPAPKPDAGTEPSPDEEPPAADNPLAGPDVRSDSFVRKYELAHADGRWNLRSQEIEAWERLAWDYALREQ